MGAIIVIVIIALMLAHLAGGARAHRRHYRQHGLHPNLYYTYGRGWYGFDPAAWRIPGRAPAVNRI